MRYFLNISLILFACACQGAVQVNYFKSDSGSVKGYYHWGTTASQMRESLFKQLEGNYSSTVRACPFWPQPFHRGAGFCYSGDTGWVSAVTKDAKYILEEVNPLWFPNGDVTLIHQGFLKTFCAGCTGNLEMLREYSCFVVPGSGADESWLWDGTAQNNKLVKNLTFTFDENGNINGYSCEVDTFALPFGAVEGEGGNGTIVFNPTTGPTWQWNPGVNPPIDPNLISSISESMGDITDLLTLNNETLASLLASGTLTSDQIASVVTSLDLLNISQESSLLALQGMNTTLEDLALIMASGSSGDVVEQLLLLQDTMIGDEPEDTTHGVDSSLVNAHNNMINALDTSTMQSQISALSSAGQLFKSTVNTIFGSWQSLPRTKPDWGFNFADTIGGVSFSWSWNTADSVPDSFWAFVRMLRAFEVLGLAVMLLFALSNLLHKTFGGAS